MSETYTMPQSSIIIVAIIPRPDRMGALNELNIRLERVSPAILYVCSLVSTQQSGNFLIKTIESLRSHTHHHIVSYQCNARIGIVRTQSTFEPTCESDIPHKCKCTWHIPRLQNIIYEPWTIPKILYTLISHSSHIRICVDSSRIEFGHNCGFIVGDCLVRYSAGDVWSVLDCIQLVNEIL